jgi:cation-transporting ATPase E
MVPEGLILLTSVAFAVGVVRVARQHTLVQELPAIEVLARVDVICLDKTGTITSGAMDVTDVDVLDDDRRDDIERALAAIAWSDRHPNTTQAALQRRFPDPPDWTLAGSVAFSSARKWSAGAFDGHGTWVLGAPEFVLDEERYAPVEAAVTDAADHGKRVLLLAASDDVAIDEALPDDLDPVALIPTFILGCLLAYLYQRSNSVWPGVIVHMLVNSLGLCVAYVVTQYPGLIPS